MYIIERPRYSYGIYAILNVVEKKIYLGQSSNLPRRTREHFEAIKTGKPLPENENLLQEKNKKFLHFVIEYDTDIDSKKLEDVNLVGHEQLFILIAKELGFELYNKVKRQPVLDEKNNMKSAFCEAIKNKTGYEVTDILNSDNICEVWESIVKKYKNLEKENSIDYLVVDLDKNDNSEKAINVLERFWFSKQDLNKMGVIWNDNNSFSITDEKNVNFDNGVIIAKMGPHNQESPYEILYKMVMNINKVGYSLWGFRNINGDRVKKVIEEQRENIELPILFITTPSEQNDANIENTNLNRKSNNDNKTDKSYSPEKMYSFINESGEWERIPKEHLDVTMPESRGKASGLIIKDLRFCKQAIDFDQFIALFNSYSNGSSQSTEAKKTFKGQVSVRYVEPNNKITTNQLENCILGKTNSETTNCLLATLIPPYITELSHTPYLDEYIKEKTYDETDDKKTTHHVILLEGPKIEKGTKLRNKSINRVFVFLPKNKVCYCNCERDITYGSYPEKSDEEHCKLISNDNDRKEAKYRINENIISILNNTEEVLFKIELSNEVFEKFVKAKCEFNVSTGVSIRSEKCCYFGINGIASDNDNMCKSYTIAVRGEKLKNPLFIIPPKKEI